MNKKKRKPIPKVEEKIKEFKKEAEEEAEAIEEKNAFESCGKYNDQVVAKHLPEEITNSYENYEHVRWEFTRWRKSKRAKIMGELRGMNKGPILCLASGPSLDSALPLLKEWRGAVICSPSHATSCVHAGKDPTYIMALDHRHVPAELNCNYWHGRDSVLITHPCETPALLKFWKGQTYYFRKLIREIPFHADVMLIAYSKWIPDHLYVFCSSLPAQMGIAYMAGYNPIFLVGCDFGISRFRKWTYEKRSKWLPRMMPFGKWVQEERRSPETKDLVKTRNGVLTNKMQLYYKRATICGWRLDLSQIILADDGKGTSILEEFPKADLRKVIEQQGQGFDDLLLTEAEIRDRADRYLMTQKTFAIPTGPYGSGEGTIFQEFADWHKSMPYYIKDLNHAGAKADLKEVLEHYERLEDENRRAADSDDGR